MTQDEILDLVVEIIENYPSPLPEEVKAEWQQLNDDIRKLQDKPTYGLGFWHKGYDIHFHGRKILHAKMSQEQYEDMCEIFSSRMTVAEYNEKWKKETPP